MTPATLNELNALLERSRDAGRKLLMPYLTAGFPQPDSFVDLACALFDAGADVLELGIPFSDPLLDGPTVQRSQQAALDQKITPAKTLRFAHEIRARGHGPVVLMGAYNPIFAYGLERFASDAASAGASGLIVPDLPFEEQGELREATARAELGLIEMVAPTSTDERLREICANASGFIYCVSVAGVTGAREHVSEGARTLVHRVRELCDVPVAVGFGVSGPQQARAVADFADGVIVGAALITVVGSARAETVVAEATSFIKSLRSAIDNSG